MNTLKKDWNPTNWSLYNIFEVVKCLLIVPFPESALNEQAGKLFMDNYEEYFKHAKLITSLYATPKELKTLENVITLLYRILLKPSFKLIKRKKLRLSLFQFRQKNRTITKRSGWREYDRLQSLYFIFFLLAICIKSLFPWISRCFLLY